MKNTLTMEMNNFYKFLAEASQNTDELSKEVIAMLDELEPDEIDALGFYLDDQFFAGSDSEDDLDLSDADEDYQDEYSRQDVEEMIKALIDFDADFADELEDIIDGELDLDDDDDLTDGELDESGPSRIMKKRNMNKKKRKYMSKSQADLRREKAERKKKNRQNKSKNKRYYRANKKKIQSYQKSRNSAIKKGKHNTKIRRKS